MLNSRKIIITGPPGSGKTTLKQVFFDRVNPITLLNNPLDPTRGAETSVFDLFQQKIALFDLAGQENEDWLTNEKEIFKFSDVIIMVFDLTTHIKDIIVFIKRSLEVYEEMRIKCPIIILLHKVDLIDRLYLHHKLDLLNNEIKDKKPLDIKIHTTSITRKYFIETFQIFSDITSDVLKQDNISIKEENIQDYKLDLEILIKYKILTELKIEKLFYDFNLSAEKSRYHLQRLEKMGFVSRNADTMTFQLTEKAIFLKPDVDSENKSERERKITRILECLYLSSNIKNV